MKWINFIHIYQPPTSDRERIERIVEESYKFIVKMLRENPDFKLTVNINGSLTEQLVKFGYLDLLNELKEFLAKGQIELTETAAYHPILALIPEEEIKRQIRLNREINSKVFGKHYNPNGFYIPEMAYTKEVAKVVSDLGYKWTILDEINYNGKLGQVDYSNRYKIRGTNLDVIFRNRNVSQSYVPSKILNLLEDKKMPELLITGTDGEIYGHRHKDDKGLLSRLLKEKEIETQTISDFLSNLKKESEVELVKGSWESEEQELKKKKPFMVWCNPDNRIHKKMWRLTNLAIETVNHHQNDSNFSWARYHLDRGLASCTYWWASAKDFKLLSPLAWNPDEIEKGLDELIKSIRSLVDVNCHIKIKAEKIYINIKQDIWRKHWGNYARGICK